MIYRSQVTIPILEKIPDDSVESAPDSPVSKEITAEVRAGHCACEVKNPKGTCCLGDVIAIERATLAGRSREHEEKVDAHEAPACHC